MHTGDRKPDERRRRPRYDNSCIVSKLTYDAANKTSVIVMRPCGQKERSMVEDICETIGFKPRVKKCSSRDDESEEST